MKFRNLDNNGDWNFGRGKSDFIAQNDAIGLNIKTRLNSWVNDCFFNQTAGIDWLNRLGSTGQRELLELDIKRIIQQSEDVTGILSFDTFLNGRSFTAEYSVETVYSKSYEDKLELEL
tara:strand:+ start:63 stop:416 length:354 start_codon:yes stop_codon:yes gene_type:complete